MAKRINATFRNEHSGDEVNRDIDISLFYVTHGRRRIIHDPEIQRNLLLDWIERRGNAEHDCELALISWAIVPY